MTDAAELLDLPLEVSRAATAAVLDFFSERLPAEDFADLLTCLGPLPHPAAAAVSTALPAPIAPSLARALDGTLRRLDAPGRPTLQFFLALRASGLPHHAVAPFVLLLWRTIEQRAPASLLASLERRGLALVALVRDAEGMLGDDALSPRLS